VRGGARTIDGQLSFAVLLEDPEAPDPVEAPEATPAAGRKDAQPGPEVRGVADGADTAGSTDRAAPADPADPADWHAILDFERSWSGPLSAKQREVRDRFGIGSARYHQLLDRALERPDALVYDPALVGRLRRLRDARRRKRSIARLDMKMPEGGGGD
jgi:hypothetical protein